MFSRIWIRLQLSDIQSNHNYPEHPPPARIIDVNFKPCLSDIVCKYMNAWSNTCFSPETSVSIRYKSNSDRRYRPLG
jgi:hypothetical protein